MTTGRCPIPDCPRPARDGHLMCFVHWFRVPRLLRERVWAEYRKQPGSGAHLKACQEAIEAASRATVGPLAPPREDPLFDNTTRKDE